jgi:hypothetical protein
MPKPVTVCPGWIPTPPVVIVTVVDVIGVAAEVGKATLLEPLPILTTTVPVAMPVPLTPLPATIPLAVGLAKIKIAEAPFAAVAVVLILVAEAATEVTRVAGIAVIPTPVTVWPTRIPAVLGTLMVEEPDWNVAVVGTGAPARGGVKTVVPPGMPGAPLAVSTNWPTAIPVLLVTVRTGEPTVPVPDVVAITAELPMKFTVVTAPTGVAESVTTLPATAVTVAPKGILGA